MNCYDSFLAKSLCHEGSTDSRVHASRQQHQDLLRVGHLVLDGLHALSLSVLKSERPREPADVVQEVFHDLLSVFCQVHLWMELDAVDVRLFVANAGYDTGLGRSDDLVVLSHLVNAVAMRKKNVLFLVQALEQRALVINLDLNLCKIYL